MTNVGTLSLRFGPMWAKKTKWLNNVLGEAADLGYKVLKIIHADDIRSSLNGSSGPVEDSSSHDTSYIKLSPKITRIRTHVLADIFDLVDVNEFQVIGIDEAQFFPDLYNVVKLLVKSHKKFLKVVGLDGDSEQNTFGKDEKTSNILDLIPLSNDAKKLTACCRMCTSELEAAGFGHIKNEAPFTKRLVVSTDQKLVGGEEIYAPVCRQHHNI